MTITSGKVQSLFHYHWCRVWLSCRPVGVCSKFFTETSRNSAGAQREFNGDDVWQSPVSFTSSLVTGMAFLPVYGTSVHTVC